MAYVTRTYACAHMIGWLSPYNAISAYQTSWSLNKAICARRTKCHSPLTHIIMKNYKLLSNYLIHMWAVPRDCYLLLGSLDYTNYYFMNVFLCYCINTCSKLLPNKYMELSYTKAIVGVPRPGSYSLCSYISNAHPIIGLIIEIENYKM